MRYETMTVQALRVLCRARVTLVGAWIASATKSALINALLADDEQKQRSQPKQPAIVQTQPQQQSQSANNYATAETAKEPTKPPFSVVFPERDVKQAEEKESVSRIASIESKLDRVLEEIEKIKRLL